MIKLIIHLNCDIIIYIECFLWKKIFKKNCLIQRETIYMCKSLYFITLFFWMELYNFEYF